ncbi:long-chain acyl-CoA synthetase [Theileria orientalis]|uniref:Long-chain acyl-CoA synthetase n=1 Tax=Theileria orientalis TaxID=68886 RepID=A0A976QR80_THEOR|nr:long-chain acyl-CoA synthetase [Theileria orientalis]
MKESDFFAYDTLLEAERLGRRPLGNFMYSKLKEKNSRSDESDVYCAIDDDELSPVKKAKIPDHVTSTFGLLAESAKYFGNKPHMGVREKIPLPDGGFKFGEYIYTSYNESLRLAKIIGTALTKENLVPEFTVDHCKIVKKARFLGIWSVNCPYWLLTDYACAGYGIVTVPIYETLGDDALFKIMSTTKMQTVCIDSNKLNNLEHLYKEMKHLKTVIVYNTLTEEDKQRLVNMNLDYYFMDDLIEKYKNDIVEPPHRKRTDICTIIYTSGTSGTPKGSVYDNFGLMALVERLLNVQNRCKLRLGSSILSFLPLSHVYERFIEHLICSLSGTVGYYSGNIKNILEDLDKLKPNFLVAVPRVFTRILARVRGQIDSKPAFLRKIVYFFVERKKRIFRRRPESSDHPIYDILLKKIKKKFGGNFETMVLGSASMTDGDIYDMQAFMSSPLAEGWGTTELGVAVLQDFRDSLKGTIGGPLYSVEFKIRSIEELGYDARGSPPRGELMIRAPGIMLGYFAEEALTNEVLDEDGWYRTGDVVELLPNMGLKILDRARNFFKISQGEYIAPDKLENAYVNAKLVEQVYIHGESTEAHLVGIVVVSKEEVEKWAQQNGLGDKSVSDLLTNDKLYNNIKEDFDKIAKSQHFNSLERLRVFTLVDTPFTVENEMLTPTFKSVRNKIKSHYSLVLKNLYLNARAVD